MGQKPKLNSWEDKFGEAKLLIGAANVICGEATWSLLIKTAFGRFNQLVYITIKGLLSV